MRLGREAESRQAAAALNRETALAAVVAKASAVSERAAAVTEAQAAAKSLRERVMYEKQQAAAVRRYVQLGRAARKSVIVDVPGFGGGGDAGAPALVARLMRHPPRGRRRGAWSSRRRRLRAAAPSPRATRRRRHRRQSSEARASRTRRRGTSAGGGRGARGGAAAVERREKVKFNARVARRASRASTPPSARSEVARRRRRRGRGGEGRLRRRAARGDPACAGEAGRPPAPAQSEVKRRKDVVLTALCAREMYVVKTAARAPRLLRRVSGRRGFVRAGAKLRRGGGEALVGGGLHPGAPRGRGFRGQQQTMRVPTPVQAEKSRENATSLPRRPFP